MSVKRWDWVAVIAWGVAIGVLATSGYLSWRRWQSSSAADQPIMTQTPLKPTTLSPTNPNPLPADLPAYRTLAQQGPIVRLAALHTEIPNRPRRDAVEYTVGLGDSVFAIAQRFGVSPETVLWANYDELKDNPHALEEGMVLQIPPTNGVYYQWQEGDTLESVAGEFEAKVEDILAWPGNRLDLTNPEILPGSWVMVPGGQREFQQWIVPVMPRGAAGVSTGVYGSGACAGGYEGIYGSGAFIWPAINTTLSGNDYWSGHLAIDIGTAYGEPIYAADSGVVVFAGWSTGGYGYTVAIDHGNGYQTLYAHLSSVVARCGQSVVQGQVIAYSGSSGNSTGPHLHFEVRYQGGFVNPWYVLPAP